MGKSPQSDAEIFPSATLFTTKSRSLMMEQWNAYCVDLSQEDMTLALHLTKKEGALSKGAVWMLGRGIFLMLLFTHQAWGSIICQCLDESDALHACCLSEQHPAEIHQEGDDGHCPILWAEKIAPVFDDDALVNITRGADSCCYIAPQTEAQIVEIILFSTVQAEQSASVPDVGAFKTAKPDSLFVFQSARSRPLYLTHSSLLI